MYVLCFSCSCTHGFYFDSWKHLPEICALKIDLSSINPILISKITAEADMLSAFTHLPSINTCGHLVEIIVDKH